MARINVKAIVEKLDSDFRRALQDAVSEATGQQVDAYELLRIFKRTVGRRFNQWEQVPNSCIRDWED